MDNRKPFIDFDFGKVKATGWPVIIAFVLASLLFSTIINLVAFPADIFSPVTRFTSGIIQPTLIVNLISLVLIVGGVLILAGRLGKKDLGIYGSLLPQAVLITFGLWLNIQILGALVVFMRDGSLLLDSLWQEWEWTIIAGALIAQILGNALVEEVGFRGFLLPQLVLKFQKLNSNNIARKPIACGIVFSQLAFSVSHIPNRIYLGVPTSDWPLDLFTLLGVGVLYAFVYLRTGNLFIVVGLHALANMPASLFLAQDIARYVVQAFALMLIIIWKPSWNSSSQFTQNAGNSNY